MKSHKHQDGTTPIFLNLWVHNLIEHKQVNRISTPDVSTSLLLRTTYLRISKSQAVFFRFGDLTGRSTALEELL